MSNYRRPRWLIVNRSAELISTVQEISSPGERVFIIRGEPLVQGLAWLTWGPTAALLAVILMAGLAITFDVREQSRAIQALFIVAFLALPALFWGGTAVVLTQLSDKHLRAERQASSLECIIRLNQKEGKLFYQTTAHPQEKKLAYSDIRQARVTYPIGGREGRAPRLALDTAGGTVILLNEALGTQTQKIDLVNEIQEALRTYLGQ